MTRWFFPHARHTDGDPTQPSSVEFTVTGAPSPVHAPGPALPLAGPADVTAIDPSLVLRTEPPPGTTDAPENIMASVDFAHADLPWLLSTRPVATPAGPQTRPWIVLLVLAQTEAAPPRSADPSPLLDVPPALLPPLQDSWAWAHVEGRFDATVANPATAAAFALDALRTPNAGVVARLICPRQLTPNTDFFAAVVPAPADARWPAPGPGGTVTLPVVHWWRFHTGQSGTFEELARRLSKNVTTNGADEVGSRTVDVSRPWPQRPVTAPVTVAIDGALRLGEHTHPETWSDPTLQNAFVATLTAELAATTAARPPLPPAAGSAGSGDLPTVGPPVYGATLTGTTGGPPPANTWMTTLNTEVRRRVAAALGARYVQVEQEFLMARAWEQVGQINEANRLLAIAELADATARKAQRKHVVPLATADLVTLMGPAASRVVLPTSFLRRGGQPAPTMAAVVEAGMSRGLDSTAFSRLTRPGGALARRVHRMTPMTVDGPPIDVAALTALNAPMRTLSGDTEPTTFPEAVRARIEPTALQLLRMSALIPAVADRVISPDSATHLRPLRPIMAHPQFSVPIAAEILSRWPDWAMPGLTELPEDSVTLLDTNPAFVAAVLVGLNEEFNRELLWREFPTDLRGTAFAKFWPSDTPDIDEIADWSPLAPLGAELKGGEQGIAVVAVRGALMRRFPHTALLAVPGDDGRVPDDMSQALTATALRLDDATVLYLFPGLDQQKAIDQHWLFVLREPVHGTQFGYDIGAAQPSIATWSDLTWATVSTHPNRYVDVGATTVTAAERGVSDPPRWGTTSADMARIAFQQPFQLAIPATDWLGTP